LFMPLRDRTRSGYSRGIQGKNHATETHRDKEVW
jgi:hypothetical protein